MGTVDLLLGGDPCAGTLRLPCSESAIGVIRQFVAGMAEVLAVEPSSAEDLKLAATEAANNVVMHAYPSTPGAIEVGVTADPHAVTLSVSDSGRGPPPEDEVEGEEAGFGLSLIRAVADGVELREAPGGGTRLRMTFLGTRRTPASSGDPGQAAVLRRVVALMAASSGFSMDRLSDAVLVAETLAAHAGTHAFDGMIHVEVEDRPDDLGLRVGPLASGGGRRLLDDSTLPAFGHVLEHLADYVGIEPEARTDDTAEFLVVELRAR